MNGVRAEGVGKPVTTEILKRRQTNKTWRLNHAKAARVADRNWKRRHRESLRAKDKRRRHERRMRVLLKCGSARCARCGVTDQRILEINHRTGGGRQEIYARRGGAD